MAGNEWINGYLEAILDAGAGKLDGKKGSMVTRNGFQYSPTCKYFVEEVVNGFDESDLHRTWIKVIATRNTRERNNRLENMCWRIWHLTRKKKQIAWEDAQRLAKRRMEREQGRNDAAEDLSELSEGEREKGDGTQAKDGFARVNSDMQIWPGEDNTKRVYIVLISLHGLVRGENMELGRDSDTGGQVKYVVELAKALAASKGVYRVDLLTRQISSPEVDWSYGEPTEMLACYPAAAGHSSGAYIIRLPCGPSDKYIAKESLWPYIPEFVDRALTHIVDMARALADEVDGVGGKPAWPYVIHGHYADAGEVAARLAGALNVPMVLTGHSLGRNKFEQLLKQGRLSRDDINATYKIMRRIEAEEVGLDAAEMVVTSTGQEIEEQWGLYDGFDVKLERKLRVRRRRGVSCLGRYMPRMVVIPPGMDFSYVSAQENPEIDGDLKALIGSDRNNTKRNLPPIWPEIMRFFTNPHKPMILALSRPDPKKNVTTLLMAFGECHPLRELANLTLILGNRDDIEEMSTGSSTVLTAVLKMIDKYDLYGQVAYPKHHKQCEVPEIYRLAAKTKGVFINPALVEPFGLTLIEAAAYGLPTVATKNGGPVDIHKALNNGLLIDPHDQKEIADALLKLLADKSMWVECRKNGIKNIHRFSWPEHCRNYLSQVEHCRRRHPTSKLEIGPSLEEPMSDSLRDVEDLSIKLSLDLDMKINGELDDTGRQKAVVDALSHRRYRIEHPPIIGNGSTSDFSPCRRLRLFVVAADCYNANGGFDGGLKDVLERVFAVGKQGPVGHAGFVFSTGSSIDETMEVLRFCQVAPEEFDVLICNSGSEMYYPWKDMVSDAEYGAHIEYKWPGENVKFLIPRISKIEGGEENDVEEVDRLRCYAYSVIPGAKARKVDEFRQRLRMRGFRCNVVYVRAATRLNVIPPFASRAQALRYLSIRWGLSIERMALFVGEKGDTDHEELCAGLLKTVQLKGLVSVGSESLMRGEDGYKSEDAVPSFNPNMEQVEGGFSEEDVLLALRKLGVD